MHSLRRLLVPVLVVLTTAACGPADGQGGNGIFLPPGGEPSSDPCGPGRHLIDDRCDATLVWAPEDVRFPVKIEDSAAGVLTSGDRHGLMVAGGRDENGPTDEVRLAPLDVAGRPTTWYSAPRLPSKTMGAAAVTLGSTFVLTGGASEAGVLSQSLSISLTREGELGAWSVGAGALPSPRFMHTLATDGSALFLVGGSTGHEALDEVLTTSLDERGRVRAWNLVSRLPAPVSHHASVLHGDFLYVLGGLRGDPTADAEPLREVLRARVGPEGSLGEWVKDTSLPESLTTAAAFATGGYLWVAGGLERNTLAVATVRRAPIHEDGSLGAWEVVTRMPAPRGHAGSTTLFQGQLYAVGGADMNLMPMNDLELGHFE